MGLRENSTSTELNCYVMFKPVRESLAWQPGNASSLPIIASNVSAEVPGYVVARMRGCNQSEDDIADGAWVIPHHLYLTWTNAPLVNDIKVLKMSAVVPGNIVARPIVEGLMVYVKGLGEVRNDLVPDFVRRCFEEDARLSLVYHFDELGQPLKRADDFKFQSLVDLVAHAIDHVGVDILEELRQQPARYPLARAWLEATERE